MDLYDCIKNIDREKINMIELQKMVFIFNALEKGWGIKKKGQRFVFSKNHEGKKEVFTDAYLKRFIKSNLFKD